MRAIQTGVIIFVAGIVSLVMSIIASGIQYRIAENRGDEDLTATTWELTWHYLSFAVIVLGILYFVVALTVYMLRKEKNR